MELNQAFWLAVSSLDRFSAYQQLRLQTSAEQWQTINEALPSSSWPRATSTSAPDSRTSLGRWATQLRRLKTGPTYLDPEDCRYELGYLGGVHEEGPGEVGGGQDHGAFRLLGKRAELFITVRPGRSR
jgi:hypothetical protein